MIHNQDKRVEEHSAAQPWLVDVANGDSYEWKRHVCNECTKSDQEGSYTDDYTRSTTN